ncbi:hypothetical protein [Flammeovirga kamogawensis]|uniref:Lipoprotein n=1 Tax=Flammeovirga kamogawensis TaxID=373891 RepID=A0ABX8GYL9_9BACT|nr:hypothetical protein [Flammeovirga kamogawensis]MBB6459142.1 isopentenyl phosphate kinase [Flammeovirga kamogawensis]QWG08709.1 hypothetical protein KM029_07160 [Flammeovirga kamogawensis]TRX67003.1 hypothetical protein EO216_02205 [Flammeovirga kamogawensis]
MSKFLQLYFFPYCVLSLLLFSACDKEETNINSCDEEVVKNKFETYVEIVGDAIENSDCETIVASSDEMLEFLDVNYNCLIILLVLNEDGVNSEAEADESIKEMRELIEELKYLCEVGAPFQKL